MEIFNISSERAGYAYRYCTKGTSATVGGDHPLLLMLKILGWKRFFRRENNPKMENQGFSISLVDSPMKRFQCPSTFENAKIFFLALLSFDLHCIILKICLMQFSVLPSPSYRGSWFLTQYQSVWSSKQSRHYSRYYFYFMRTLHCFLCSSNCVT